MKELRTTWWLCLGSTLGIACGGPAERQDADAPGEKRARAAATATRPVQTPFIPMNDTATKPPGVHSSHGSHACKVCHLQGGAVQFDPRGPAIVPGTLATDAQGNVILDSNGKATILKPAQLPSYNTTTGSCSNIACHWVPPGQYTPQFAWWDTSAWTYGSPAPTPTPDWLSTPGSAGCTACHGYPPKESGGPWHSGYHANTSVTDPRNPDVLGFNACSTCHSGVTSRLVDAGTPAGQIVTIITNPTMHNGVVNVDWNPGSIPEDFCNNCHFSF